MTDDALRKALYDADGTDAIDDNDEAVRTARGEAEAHMVLVGGTDGTNAIPLKVNADGELPVNLEASDIEIGAVELKNATTDDRAEIGDANTARTTGTHVIAVQHVDADGEVLDASDLEALGDTVGTPDSAAPGTAQNVGGEYEAVLTEVDDGDFKTLMLDAFGRLENAFYDRATNTGLTSDPDPLAAKSGYVVMIDETLDADPTSSTSPAFFIGDKNKVSFLIMTDVDWTDSNPDISVAYVVWVSADGTTYIPCNVIMDSNGTDAPVASIVHTTGGDSDLVSYDTCHLPIGFTAQYVKVIATATNSDADDTAVCDCWLCWKKG